MDSEEEKEFEKRQKELEEQFENSLQIIFGKNNVEEWSLINRILVYVIFTLFIFIGGLFSIAKKIIFFRFLKIQIDFQTMRFMDCFLKKFFKI